MSGRKIGVFTLLLACWSAAGCYYPYQYNSVKPTLPPQASVEANVPEDIRPLVLQLYSREYLDRVRAVTALGDKGEEAATAIPYLIGMFSDQAEIEDTREGIDTIGDLAKETLKKIGKPAIQPLFDALSSDEKQIQERAAETLGEWSRDRKVPEIMSLLVHTLQQGNWIARMNAAVAVSHAGLKDERLLEPLMANLEHKSANRYLLEKTITALGGLKDRRAVMPLIEQLYSTDCYVRAAAAAALATIGDERALIPFEDVLGVTHHREIPACTPASWTFGKASMCRFIKQHRDTVPYECSGWVDKD